MKTTLCKLLAYCETSGAPVCICSARDIQNWVGSDDERTLYWNVVDLIKQNLLFNYNQQFSFFNTETGNFTLFRSQKELIIAEIISIEAHAVIPWSGIEFDIDSNNPLGLNLSGMICFFDSSMMIESHSTSQECLLDVGEYGVWNAAVLKCAYTKAFEVSYKSDTMHLTGICFQQ